MGLRRRIKKFIILLMIFICTYNANTIFANNKSIKSFYFDTVGDALNFSTTNSLEEALREYMKDSSFFNGYGRIEDVTEEDDNLWFDKFDTYKENASKISKENIGIEIENIKQQLGIQNNLQINIIIYISLFLIAIILLILGKKKIFYIFSLCSIFVFVINLIYVYNRDNGKFTSDITFFLEGKKTSSISAEIKNKYNEEYIKEECDKDWNISYFINDYIAKVLYCVKCKSNGQKPVVNDMYKTIKDTNEMPFLFESNRVMTTDGNYCSDQDEYVDGTKYLFNDFGVYSEYITEEDMIKIYDSITEEDCEDYKNGIFTKKLVKKIDNLINSRNFEDFNEMLLCDFFEIIFPEMYFLIYGRIENNDSVVFHIKYWYINGESRDIELPYGVTIHYEKPRYEDKDIKEIVCNNYDLLEKQSNELQYLYNYYVDSKGKYNGSFAEIKFIDEGGQRKAFFNPYDLTKNIKRAKISTQ